MIVIVKLFFRNKVRNKFPVYEERSRITTVHQRSNSNSGKNNEK